MTTHATETAVNAVNEIPATSGAKGHWMQLCASVIRGQTVVAWRSVEWDEPVWDDFLGKTPLGQFQQSSLWARAKRIDGWRPVRVLITVDGRLAGGFQILGRKTRFGSVAYISKGPVLVPELDSLKEFAMELVVSTVRAERFRALILQPPDASRMDDFLLARHGFLSNHFVGVNSATLVVDVSCDMAEIVRRMRRTTMLELKRSRKRGIQIREGGESDLPTFFRLMTATCQRQKTIPSPATESALREIWKIFSNAGRSRVAFAEYEGAPVAAAVCLCFGHRVTFWKKGWTGEHRERHPNQMVMYDAIQWSHQQGYKLFDCAAMNRGTALTLLNGQPLSETQKKARDFFLLGYGGTPTLLPESKIYFANPMLRFVYHCLTANPAVRTWIRGVVANRV